LFLARLLVHFRTPPDSFEPRRTAPVLAAKILHMPTGRRPLAVPTTAGIATRSSWIDQCRIWRWALVFKQTLFIPSPQPRPVYKKTWEAHCGPLGAYCGDGAPPSGSDTYCGSDCEEGGGCADKWIGRCDRAMERDAPIPGSPLDLPFVCGALPGGGTIAGGGYLRCSPRRWHTRRPTRRWSLQLLLLGIGWRRRWLLARCGGSVALMAELVDPVAVCSGASAQTASTAAPLVHVSYPVYVELLQAVSGLPALLRVLRWVRRLEDCFLSPRTWCSKCPRYRRFAMRVLTCVAITRPGAWR
jgi:hypothetical protein